MTQYLPKGLVECFMGTRGSSSSTMYSYWGGLVLETDTNAASASALAPTPAMERVAELSDVTDPLSLFSETTTNTIDGNSKRQISSNQILSASDKASISKILHIARARSAASGPCRRLASRVWPRQPLPKPWPMLSFILALVRVVRGYEYKSTATDGNEENGNERERTGTNGNERELTGTDGN